jgi:hypothetical protein
MDLVESVTQSPTQRRLLNASIDDIATHTGIELNTIRDRRKKLTRIPKWRWNEDRNASKRGMNPQQKVELAGTIRSNCIDQNRYRPFRTINLLALRIISAARKGMKVTYALTWTIRMAHVMRPVELSKRRCIRNGLLEDH